MSGGLPILTYHALDDSGSPVATAPLAFARTIERLVEAGFVGVDLADWVARGRPRVDRGFAVAFDDGLRSILGGVEVLRRHGLPATVFLVTDRVGDDDRWPGQPPSIPRARLLDWSEVAELARLGVSIGAHSRTHPRLDRLPTAEAEAELLGSRDAIEARLGRSCRLFAYPYGASSRAVRSRASVAFAASFTTRQARASAADDAATLPRIDAYYLRSPRVLDRLVSGRLDIWLTLRRALRTARAATTSLGAAAR